MVEWSAANNGYIWISTLLRHPKLQQRYICCYDLKFNGNDSPQNVKLLYDS